MIWVLGASGYIGQAFITGAKSTKVPARPVSRTGLDYADFRALLAALRGEKPELVVNAARFTGKPNVDACENHRLETVAGNVALAQSVAQACEVAEIKNQILK